MTPLGICRECQQFVQRRAIGCCRRRYLRQHDVNHIDFLARGDCLSQNPGTIECAVSRGIIPCAWGAKGEQCLRFCFTGLKLGPPRSHG